MTSAPVVVTKLSPPLIRTNTLRRSTLAKKLNRVTEFPVALIHAGPGFGKSTSLALLFQSSKYKKAWYSISPQDDNFSAFFLHLVYAVRTAFPDFGEDTVRLISHQALLVRSEEWSQVSNSFINELARLPDQFLLIIDDFHLIQNHAAINACMQYLLEHMPDHLHIVLSSRHHPGWSILSRMKLLGTMLEITESDLMFTEEETEVLFHDSYDFPLPAEQIRQIYEATEGWVIAVQLIWHRLQAGGELTALLSRPDTDLNDLFRFLAMEVLQKQPQQLQAFLVQTSVLEELDMKVCESLTGMADTAGILEHLLEQRLFVSATGAGQYRYHSLFREFLHKQLSLHKELWSQTHLKAALCYEERGKPAQAIHHLSVLGENDRLARLLELHGDTILSGGRLGYVQGIVKTIPPEVKDRYPIVWFYEGETYRYRCEFQRASQCYERAKRLGIESGEVIAQALGTEGQARIFLDTIQPDQAERLLRSALSLIESAADRKQTQLIKNRLYRLMAENLLNAGKTEEAPLWVAKSREQSEEAPADELTVRLHLRTGRLHSVKQMLERSKEEEGKAGISEALSRSHRETELLLSLTEAFLGEPEKAKRHAQEGMMNGVNRKAPFVEAVGWMRLGHAAQMLSAYEFHVPLNCYKTAIGIMEQLGVSRGKAEPLMGLCLLYGREGAYETAEQYGMQALEETENVKDLWLSSFIRLGLAVSAFESGRPEQSRKWLDHCSVSFAECGDSYGLALSCMWTAIIAYHEDSADVFETSMDSFLRVVQTGEYEFLFIRKTLFGPRDVQALAPLLFEAQKRDIQKHYVGYLLSLLGIDHMDFHPGYTLRIETLGDFRVWLGEKPLEERDWQRGKAKELFQLLLTKRRQLLPKEEIFAALWKDTDEKTAARDFKVALNALNTALEPGRKARSTPFFIQRLGTSYGMNLASGFRLDIVEFDGYLRAGLGEKDGERAKEALLKGLQLYKGDYMPERRYDDWCAEERERLLVLYLRGMEKLAGLLAESGDWDASIDWCERILEKDICWEEAYRLLMKCHYNKNNRRQAAKYYQKCCEVLMKELGTGPMPATRMLYEKIMDSAVTDL